MHWTLLFSRSTCKGGDVLWSHNGFQNSRRSVVRHKRMLGARPARALHVEDAHHAPAVVHVPHLRTARCCLQTADCKAPDWQFQAIDAEQQQQQQRPLSSA